MRLAQLTFIGGGAAVFVNPARVVDLQPGKNPGTTYVYIGETDDSFFVVQGEPGEVADKIDAALAADK